MLFWAAAVVLLRDQWNYELGYKVSGNNRIKPHEIMKKYIHIQKADREFLAKTFKVSKRTVYNAIHFVRRNEDNNLAKQIRSLALQRGGIVMLAAPAAETFHDSDGYMRQYLPSGVLLEFSLEEGSCVVFQRYEQIRRYEHVLISDIPAIQAYAATLK